MTVNVATKETVTRFEVAADGLCNDITVDAQGNVYATDSFAGVIYRAAAGQDKMEELVSDPLFLGTPDKPGLNGIVWDGQDLLVVPADTGALLRVAIEADGSAGAVTSIPTEESLGRHPSIRSYPV